MQKRTDFQTENGDNGVNIIFPNGESVKIMPGEVHIHVFDRPTSQREYLTHLTELMDRPEWPEIRDAITEVQGSDTKYQIIFVTPERPCLIITEDVGNKLSDVNLGSANLNDLMEYDENDSVIEQQCAIIIQGFTMTGMLFFLTVPTGFAYRMSMTWDNFNRITNAYPLSEGWHNLGHRSRITNLTSA